MNAPVRKNYKAYVVLKMEPFKLDIESKDQGYTIIEKMRQALTNKVHAEHPELKFDILILDENTKEVRYKFPYV